MASVWRNFLVSVFPWIFKSAVDIASTAKNKGNVGASINKTIDAASADPNVVAAEEAVIDETIRKVGKK